MRNHIAMILSVKQGQAVTLRRDIHVSIQAHVLRLSILQMGGEANSLWGYAADGGPIEKVIKTIGDPRDKERKIRLLLNMMEEVIEPYLHYCQAHDLMPQIIMANDSCRRALKVVVEDGVRSGFAPTVTKEERQRLLSLNYLVWLLKVLPENAQPLLISACDLLGSQFALPMPDHNCQHLGACLAWIKPESGGDAISASFEAADMASSLVMRPETEAEIEKDVTAYSKARNVIYYANQTGNAEPMTAKHNMKKHSSKVQKVLHAELERMHKLLGEASQILDLFIPSEAAKMLKSHYADDFKRNWPLLPGNGFWNMRQKDSPRAGSALIRREGINQSTESILQLGDKFTEMWSINSGHMVAAEILSGRMEGRKAFLLLSTPQQIVRARTNDLLNAQHSLIKSVIVHEKHQAETGYFMLVEVKSGIQKVGKLLREMRDAELVGNSLLLSSTSQDMGSVAADAGRRFKRVTTINEHLADLREIHSTEPVDNGEGFALQAKKLLKKKEEA